MTARGARIDSLRTARRRGLAALTEREAFRVLRLWRQTIVPQIIAATLFVVVFGIALGREIREIEGVPYEQFIVPGLVLMGVVTQAFANNATSLYQARSDGFIEDPVTSPMAPRHLMVGYLSGGVLRSILIAVGTLAVARIFVEYPIERPLVLAATIVIAAIGFSALGTIVGLYSTGWEQQNFTLNMVIQPLAFLGGVFYSINALSEPWRSLTFADPIFYAVSAARYGVLGEAEVSPWLSVGVTTAVSAVLLAWCWVLFRRGVGLRT